MTGWVLVILGAGAVVLVCVVVLVGVGVAGNARGASRGPLVVFGRVLFVVILLAIVVALVALVWGGVSALIPA